MTMVIVVPLTACMTSGVFLSQATLNINCQISLFANLISTDSNDRSTTRMTTTCGFDVSHRLLVMHLSLRLQSCRIGVYPRRPVVSESHVRETPVHAATSKNTKARPRAVTVIVFIASSRDLMGIA